MPSNVRPEDPQYPPLSPGTTTTILCITNNADIGETTHAVSWGLVHTICQRTAVTEEHLTTTRARINELENTIQQHEQDICRLRNE